MSGAACRVCRCTYMRPCASGCGWAEPDLCTVCELIRDVIVVRVAVLPSKWGELLEHVLGRLQRDFDLEPDDGEDPRRVRKALADVVGVGLVRRAADLTYSAELRAAKDARRRLGEDRRAVRATRTRRAHAS